MAVAFLAWTSVALILFRVWRPAPAALAAFLGGWILLPVGTYPAGSAASLFPYWITGLALPSDMALTKACIAPAAAFVGVLLFDRRALARLRPAWVDAPVALWCLWPLATAAFAVRPSPAPALASLYLAGCWGLPWLLGRLYFASAEGQLLLVKGLVVSALACLPFSLVEGAWGPTLYGLVYEPHPFRFDGDVRYFGYRPIGFFEHGNQFGLWISLCALAAVWLARAAPAGQQTRRRWLAATVVAMAIAAQSAGAIVLALVGAAVLSLCRVVRPRLMVLGATALLVVGGAVYGSGIVPLQKIAKETEVGREVVAGLRMLGRGSFSWRVAQDQKLLGAALARPLVGSAQWDWWREAQTRPWGLWLLVVGQHGVPALLLALATLLLPVLRVAWLAPRAGAWSATGLSLLLATLVALSVVDALLNAFVFFPAILAAGALAAPTDRRSA